MTKNLFLYINSSNNSEIHDSSYKDIYCIGDMIVAIDKNVYDKKERFNFQKRFNVHPYYISQKTFKEIIFVSNDIKLLNINFIDESIEDSLEYKNLQNIIYGGVSNLYETVMYIIDEFDTEIKSVTFIYKSMKIELTNEGVLNFYSNDSLLQTLTTDNKIKNLLLGEC